MNTPYIFKKCSKCGRFKVASTVNFYKQKAGKYGLRGECKECKNKYREEYYQDNKNKSSEYNKQYYQDNKYELLEYSNQYYQEHRDEKSKYRKQYYQCNKNKLSEYQKMYRKTSTGQAVLINASARRRTGQGDKVTAEQLEDMMRFFNNRCAYTGKLLTKENKSRDHIVPLNKDGMNVIWNIVPCDKKYNSRKNSKDILKWYKEQPFFSEERLQKIYEWQEYTQAKYEIMD